MDIPNLSPSEQLQVVANEIKTEGLKYDLLRREIGKVIVGQENMVRSLLIALLADGHVLLEGVPGLAKTLAIRTLSSAVSADFSRIQFTPDLMPSDIIGSEILDENRKFKFINGPVFSIISFKFSF